MNKLELLTMRWREHADVWFDEDLDVVSKCSLVETCYLQGAAFVNQHHDRVPRDKGRMNDDFDTLLDEVHLQRVIVQQHAHWLFIPSLICCSILYLIARQYLFVRLPTPQSNWRCQLRCFIAQIVEIGCTSAQIVLHVLHEILEYARVTLRMRWWCFQSKLLSTICRLTFILFEHRTLENYVQKLNNFL